MRASVDRSSATVDIESNETAKPQLHRQLTALLVPLDSQQTATDAARTEPSASADSSDRDAGTGVSNPEWLQRLRAEHEAAFLALLRDSEFEYGFQSVADAFFERFVARDRLMAIAWASAIFHDHFGDAVIAVGILRVLAHLRYEQVIPHGAMMALAATRHVSPEVQECGVRAFENWGDPAASRILEQTAFAEPWLQSYADEVKRDLALASRQDHAS